MLKQSFSHWSQGVSDSTEQLIDGSFYVYIDQLDLCWDKGREGSMFTTSGKP